MKKLLKNKKNQVLILGIAISFLLVFQLDHSPALPLIQGQVKVPALVSPSSEKDLTSGNLVSTNFLAVFFSSVVSKSKENNSDEDQCRKFTIEKVPVIKAISPAD